MSRMLWEVIQNSSSSIWVQWIYSVRLRGKTIWTVSLTEGSWSWRKMLRLRTHMLPNVIYHIGDGNRISLWHDSWHHLGPLISRFPSGLSISGTNSKDKLRHMIVDGCWPWPVLLDSVYGEIMQSLPPIHGGHDCIKWGTDRGQFDNAAAYELFHPPGPKGLLKSLGMPLYNGLLYWDDFPLLTNRGYDTLMECAYYVVMDLLRPTSICFLIVGMHNIAFLVSSGVYASCGLIGIGRMGLVGPLLDGEANMWLMLRTGLYWHLWFITYGRNKIDNGSSLLRGHLLSLDIV
ncbi:UNVERIFIED_CONTAM: hypothetical protein Slati_1337500 [Sesamum latifolium]|uniref:Uncharacterized protein n=1 Tax=Sesamum latifolium TaxID=2727402 RepID=A0AAW2XI72_9LAMI